MSWAGAQQINIEQYRGRRGYRRAAPAFVMDYTSPSPRTAALICFSHLRWHFVYQRPQHLMARFAREYRVMFVEEPVGTDAAKPWLESHAVDGGVQIVVPQMPRSLTGPEADSAQRALLDQLLATEGIRRPLLYYFTPLALRFSDRHRRIAGRLRLHGRAFRVRGRAAGNSRAGAGLAGPRGSRFHGRREPVRGQAPLASEHPRLSQQRRCRPFRARPRAAVRPGGPGAVAATAAGLLWRHRRAARPRADRCGCRHAPGLAAGHGGTGGEDRSGRAAQARQHPLARPQAVRGAAATIWPAGTLRCCLSRATNRLVSSARRRRRNTWPPAGPSSRPR